VTLVFLFDVTIQYTTTKMHSFEFVTSSKKLKKSWTKQPSYHNWFLQTQVQMSLSTIHTQENIYNNEKVKIVYYFWGSKAIYLLQILKFSLDLTTIKK
jgi:hypothetical protein